MEPDNGDEVYYDWISKWRKWKHAWCVSDEIITVFSIRAIAKKKVYTEIDHANLAHELCKLTGSRVNISKNGEILCHVSHSLTSVIVAKSPGGKGGPVADRFGIVTFELGFFRRQDILRVSLALESLGHGVIHDDGRISSTEYNDMGSAVTHRKMPQRDDPVWALV